jgi:hypothetical protein
VAQRNASSICNGTKERKDMTWTPIYLNAKTTKEISGRCIKTIPIGTALKVIINSTNSIYDRGSHVNCKSMIEGEGFGVTSVWNDEFELLPNQDLSQLTPPNDFDDIRILTGLEVKSATGKINSWGVYHDGKCMAGGFYNAFQAQHECKRLAGECLKTKYHSAKSK